MPLVPFAAFLTGALLSLLIPTLLLTALALWYWRFSMRVPDTKVADVPPAPADPPPPPGMSDPGPTPMGPSPPASEG